MTNFVQTRFLGSSVLSFTASLGWADTASQCSVALVDDTVNGDSFSPGNPGRPVLFDFNDFQFCGILQSWQENINTSGQTYEVTVTGPNDILDGSFLVLDGYTGDVSSVYNVLNVYGYLESFGFGTSQKNETGIPWKNIRDAIHSITNFSQQSTFGGPLYYIQTRYILDLYGLPDVPEDFRVGGDSISILQYITEVCEAGGCDFYVSMIEASTGVFVIKVNTVSRTAVITYGAVTQFLATYPEYESKQVGFELSNDVCSKFLIGGNIRELWYQYSDASLNTIWQFWGYDLNGNPIIGEGYGDDHTFTLDSRSVANPRVGAFYQTNVAEMRCVLAGRASWEAFLLLHRDDGGIHANKAQYLNIIGYLQNTDPQGMVQQWVDNYNLPANNHVLKLDPGTAIFPHNTSADAYEQLDVETQYLFDLLYYVATTYYGKQYMVAIPYTYSAEEPDTGKIRVSQLPVESGYLDEATWPLGISNNLLPLEVDRFAEEDGKIVAFARFNNGDSLDLSDLNPDDVGFNTRSATFGKNKLRNVAVFVKTSVYENVIYLDKATRYGPRALITFPGVVRQRVVDGDIPGKDLLIQFLKGGFSAADGGINVNSPEFKRDVIDKFIGYVGQDILNYGNESSAVSPDLVVVPLESQINCYGPWYGSGAAGKVDYEKDESLVPWNYGGWTAMNIAANSKVQQAVGTNLQIEQGEITFPDAPRHSLGQPLVSFGPIVSDISVSIGTQGAHTTYKFRRNVKQPRYGQAKAERVATLSKRAQQLRRNQRLKNNPKRRADIKLTALPISQVTKIQHPKVGKHSSHETLCGQMFTTNSGEMTSSVFLQSDYNFTSHIKYDYSNKAFMSLDGMFAPFSTTPTSGYPSFTSVSSGTSPTVDDLNRYKTGHNIKLLAGGDTLPDDLYSPTSSGYRPLALRGPLIISGPAYDISGYPVPNASPSGTSDSFASDYQTNQANWPTGPVDLRWDESRGVYAAGSAGAGLIRATMTGSLSARLSNTNRGVSVVNWLGSTIGSGDNVYLTLDNGSYYIVNQTYYGAVLVSNMICNSDGTFTTCYTSIKTPSRISTSGPSGCA